MQRIKSLESNTGVRNTFPALHQLVLSWWGGALCEAQYHTDIRDSHGRGTSHAVAGGI